MDDILREWTFTKPAPDRVEAVVQNGLIHLEFHPGYFKVSTVTYHSGWRLGPCMVTVDMRIIRQGLELLDNPNVQPLGPDDRLDLGLPPGR